MVLTVGGDIGLDAIYKYDHINEGEPRHIIEGGIVDASYRNPDYLTELNGKLYFSAGDRFHGREIWVYNPDQQGGPTNPLKVVSDIYSQDFDISQFEDEIEAGPSHLTVMNNKLYFRATNENNGTELWVYNPPEEQGIISQYGNVNGNTDSITDSITDNNPKMVADIYPGRNVDEAPNSGLPQNSDPYFTAFNDQLYFRAKNTNNNFELWKLKDKFYKSPTYDIIFSSDVIDEGDLFNPMIKQQTLLQEQYYTINLQVYLVMI